jgi:hypothetical protein
LVKQAATLFVVFNGPILHQNKMKTLLLSRRFRSLFVLHRYISNKSNKKYEGIKERFDENQARLYFDQWLKSLW